MSHTAPTTGSKDPERVPSTATTSPGDEPSSGDLQPTLWAGWVMFGSAMMVMLGAFHIVQGLVALVRSEYFRVRPDGLTVSIDYPGWGWVHLVLGSVVLAAGIGVLFGQIWARVVGVLVAMTSAVVNFAFLAAYPLWSTTMIALDVLVIWALTVHGAELKAARDRARGPHS